MKQDLGAPHSAKGGTLENYLLGRLIKEGGFGKVFYAREVGTGTEYAIKFIKKHRYRDLRRPYQEAECMRRLTHPNIIRFHELIETEEDLVLVEEYAAGGDLSDYLRRYGPLCELEARRVFRQLVSAVGYMHDIMHVAHRDLKPSNVLLATDHTVKLADFGTSRSFVERPLKTRCGTSQYMAPEVRRGDTYGPAVDVWSLGVTLFRIVTGYHPFSDSAFFQTEAQRFQLPVVDFLTPEIQHLLARMLQIDPEKRATIAEIMGDPWVNHCMDDLRAHSETSTSVSECPSLATPCPASPQLCRARLVHSCPPALPSSTNREVNRCVENVQEAEHPQERLQIPVTSVSPAPQGSSEKAGQNAASSSNTGARAMSSRLCRASSRERHGSCVQPRRRLFSFLRSLCCCGVPWRPSRVHPK